MPETSSGMTFQSFVPSCWKLLAIKSKPNRKDELAPSVDRYDEQK